MTCAAVGKGASSTHSPRGACAGTLTPRCAGDELVLPTVSLCDCDFFLVVLEVLSAVLRLDMVKDMLL